MRKRTVALVAVVAAAATFVVVRQPSSVEAQAKAGAGFAAIPGDVGGQDMFGGYNVVKGWPEDISTVPGNEKWTYEIGRAHV